MSLLLYSCVIQLLLITADSLAQRAPQWLSPWQMDGAPFMTWMNAQHTAPQMFCPYKDKASVLVDDVVKELYNMAAHSNQSRLARLFDASQGSGSFHAAHCAVVSNSGSLLHHQYGSEIDGADLVFRFNDAELSGWSAHVGQRDDIRVLNYAQASNARNSTSGMAIKTDTLYVLQRLGWDQDARELCEVTRRLHPEGHFVKGDPRVQACAQDLLHTAYGDPPQGWYDFRERHLTTGFLGVLLAVAMCDEVRAYSFQNSSASYIAPYHYYGEFSHNTSALDTHLHHTYDQERHFWEMVSRNTDGMDTDVSVIPGLSQLHCEHELAPVPTRCARLLDASAAS